MLIYYIKEYKRIYNQKFNKTLIFYLKKFLIYKIFVLFVK